MRPGLGPALAAAALAGCAAFTGGAGPGPEGRLCPEGRQLAQEERPGSREYWCELPDGVRSGPSVRFTADQVTYGWWWEDGRDGDWIVWDADQCRDLLLRFRQGREVARGLLGEIRCPDDTHHRCRLRGDDYEHWCEGRLPGSAESLWKLGPYLRAHLGRVAEKGIYHRNDRVSTWLFWDEGPPRIEDRHGWRTRPPSQLRLYELGVETRRWTPEEASPDSEPLEPL